MVSKKPPRPFINALGLKKEIDLLKQDSAKIFTTELWSSLLHATFSGKVSIV